MFTLLVSGSGNAIGNGEKIEIIKENFKTEVCNNMPNYPFLGMSAVAGATWKSGQLAVCGGYDPYFTYQECYTLENAMWTLRGNLHTARSYHGASNIGSSIWFTGGQGNCHQYGSPEWY